MENSLEQARTAHHVLLGVLAIVVVFLLGVDTFDYTYTLQQINLADQRYDTLERSIRGYLADHDDVGALQRAVDAEFTDATLDVPASLALPSSGDSFSPRLVANRVVAGAWLSVPNSAARGAFDDVDMSALSRAREMVGGANSISVVQGVLEERQNNAVPSIEVYDLDVDAQFAFVGAALAVTASMWFLTLHLRHTRALKESATLEDKQSLKTFLFTLLMPTSHQQVARLGVLTPIVVIAWLLWLAYSTQLSWITVGFIASLAALATMFAWEAQNHVAALRR